MALDLKGYNHAQLHELIAKARQREIDLRKEKLGDLRERIAALLSKEGFAHADVFPKRAIKAKGAPVAVKYRNPANKEQTWAGRGKRPRWFHEALAAGKKEKDLLAK